MKEITVVGIAQNGKAGALVKTSNDGVYYVDGLSDWPSDWVNHSVSVTGKLKEEEKGELKNEQGEWSAGVSGKVKSIHQAKWKLIGK